MEFKIEATVKIHTRKTFIEMKCKIIFKQFQRFIILQNKKQTKEKLNIKNYIYLLFIDNNYKNKYASSKSLEGI